MIRRPPRSTLFPYTRSSDLASMRWSGCCRRRERADRRKRKRLKSRSEHQNQTDRIAGKGLVANEDRKSTRLNSSHSQISYAVFCFEKKKRNKTSMYW